MFPKLLGHIRKGKEEVTEIKADKEKVILIANVGA